MYYKILNNDLTCDGIQYKAGLNTYPKGFYKRLIEDSGLLFSYGKCDFLTRSGHDCKIALIAIPEGSEVRSDEHTTELQSHSENSYADCC